MPPLERARKPWEDIVYGFTQPTFPDEDEDEDDFVEEENWDIDIVEEALRAGDLRTTAEDADIASTISTSSLDDSSETDDHPETSRFPADPESPPSRLRPVQLDCNCDVCYLKNNNLIGYGEVQDYWHTGVEHMNPDYAVTHMDSDMSEDESETQERPLKRKVSESESDDEELPVKKRANQQ